MPQKKMTEQDIWENITTTSEVLCSQSPGTKAFIKRSILDHDTLGDAVASIVVEHFDTITKDYPSAVLREMFLSALAQDDTIKEGIVADLIAVQERDPACRHLWEPLLFFKGYRSLQSYRFAHHLYCHGQEVLALVIQSCVSFSTGVDIHPASLIGKGIMMDHATGIVVGETAAIGDGSSLYHGVTLGATGKERGDRHPKIGKNVFIGANASIIGNVKIGAGSVVGAGSMVIKDIPENSTVIGNPCRVFPRSNPMSLPPR